METISICHAIDIFTSRSEDVFCVSHFFIHWLWDGLFVSIDLMLALKLYWRAKQPGIGKAKTTGAATECIFFIFF